MAVSPNPLRVGWSILRARRVRRPRPEGVGTVDHHKLARVLGGQGDLGALASARGALQEYVVELSQTDPDTLAPGEALAYWLNLYNAGALVRAGEAAAAGVDSVLRVPGAFSDPFVDVAGESLSLDDIEHGKIRRFGDPRIHGALVCGSVSCPTLRNEPYEGSRIDAQLDDQMRAFLAGGGALVTDRRVLLSRVFLWYGSDFVRPTHMPTLLPATKRQLLDALEPWLGRVSGKVEFQPYDWGLRCSIG